MDFSLQKYEELLQSLIKDDRKAITFKSYFAETQRYRSGNWVILRHDIDRWPDNAKRMAKLEAEHGVASTYYVRHVRGVYSANLLRYLHELGHEVGLHYECLSKCSGDIENSLALLRKQLADFRVIVPVDTVCMHGSPFSKFDNRDLWKHAKFSDFSLLGEPYLSVDYSNVLYATDTGRCWGSNRSANIRDEAIGATTPSLEHTDQLIQFVQAFPGLAIIQTHPERWSYDFFSHAKSVCADALVNKAKALVKMVRR